MSCEFGNFPVIDLWYREFVLLQYHATIGLCSFCFVDGIYLILKCLFLETLLERWAEVDSTPQSTLNGPFIIAVFIF